MALDGVFLRHRPLFRARFCRADRADLVSLSPPSNVLNMSQNEGEKCTEVAIGIVLKEDQILICRRKIGDSFGGYWEFPGGKCEAGETPVECVVRELREELAIEVTPLIALEAIEHQYESGRVVLYPFVCRHDGGDARAISAAEFQWVARARLGEFRFPAANDGLIESLIGEEARTEPRLPREPRPPASTIDLPVAEA
jgi:8-oxo-dGTP diphosphatase